MIKNCPKVEEKTVRPLRTRGQKRGRRGSKKVEAGLNPLKLGLHGLIFLILGALFDNFYHSDQYHFSFLL